MAEKKSLTEAALEATRLSAAHPDVTFYVMDKPRQKAVVSGSAWVYRERILDGWRCVSRYRGGEKVSASGSAK